MKVADLIEYLREMPQDAEVFTLDLETVDNVSRSEDDIESGYNRVYIETLEARDV